MARIFGLQFKRNDNSQNLKSFAEPQYDDGSVVVAGGMYGTYIDLEGTIRNESDLVSKYRNLALQPEIDRAVNEVVNESIIIENGLKIVEIILDDVPIDDNIKKLITMEFENILDILNFNNNGYDIFKKWYIDGRAYYHAIFDEKAPMEGIKELRSIDPRKIRKIREVKKNKDPDSGAMLTETTDEYYIYNEQGLSTTSKFETNSNQQGVKISKDSIIYQTSGLIDAKGQLVLSYLHPAMKPMNQLRSIEDSTLIYHLCVVGDTRVQMPNGYEYIKDVKAGDEVNVFTVNGLEIAKVKKQWCTGTREVYKVKSKHHSITATDNHPILVYDSKKDLVEYVSVDKLVPKLHSVVYEKPKEIDIPVPLTVPRKTVYKLISDTWKNEKIENKTKAVKLFSEKYGYNPNKIRSFLYGQQTVERSVVVNAVSEFNCLELAEFEESYYGNVSNEVFLPEFVDENFARLFGFLIGDGSISKNTITFAEGVDEEQNKFYASLLETYFGNCSKQSTKRKYGNWTTSNTLGAELLMSLGYIQGAHNKRIPKWLFTCRNSIKIAFIEGLSDADGTTVYSKYTGAWSSEIELCNKRLVEDIKSLWSNVGYSSGHIRHRTRKEETRQFGDDIRTIPQTESWTVYISKEPLSHLESIWSIEHVGKHPVYDIEVDHPNHNFIANEITIHNSRAPERRVFYVDTGSMPHFRAKQYMEELVNSYRTKLTYNAETGEVKDTSKTMSMLEDYWMQVREGGRGTKVETMSGGTQLSQLLETVQLFEEKLYKSLQVPISRLKQDDTYTMGRATEISRDEINFAKFIDRVRNKFSVLFVEALEKQLVLKNIVTPDDFDFIRNKIKFKYLKDNLFSELKEHEIMKERMNVLAMMMPWIGRFYSNDWVRKNVCKQSEETIEEEDQLIGMEISNPQFMPPEEEQGEPQ